MGEAVESCQVSETSELFGDILPLVRDAVLSTARRRAYACSELIFFTADPVKETFLLIEGCAKVTLVATSRKRYSHRWTAMTFTTNRILTSWEDQGLLRVGRRCIEIHDSVGLSSTALVIEDQKTTAEPVLEVLGGAFRCGSKVVDSGAVELLENRCGVRLIQQTSPRLG